MATLFKKTILLTLTLTMLMSTSTITSNQTTMNSSRTFVNDIERDVYYQQVVDNIHGPEEHIEINYANDFQLTNFNNSRNPIFELNANRLGFNIAPYWQPFGRNDFFNWIGIVYVGASSRTAFNIKINQVLLRDSRHHQNFAFAYRVVMSPNNSTERHGFLNMSVRGDQWLNRRQTTSVQLQPGQKIRTWAPINIPAPATGNSTIGVDLDSSGRPSISGTITRPSSELTIRSRTNVGNRRFEAEYNYDRGGWHRFWGTGASDYLRNSVVSFGFFIFNTAESHPRLNAIHQTRFESQNSRYNYIIITLNSWI